MKHSRRYQKGVPRIPGGIVKHPGEIPTLTGGIQTLKKEILTLTGGILVMARRILEMTPRNKTWQVIKSTKKLKEA
jgi:hypothetical protein